MRSLFRITRSLLLCALVALASYMLLDSAVANLLALDTLRHGTDLVSYAHIQVSGLQPRFAGSGDGTGARGYVYLWRERFEPDAGTVTDPTLPKWVRQVAANKRLHPIAKRWILPRYYAVHVSAKRLPYGTFIGLITPTLKFHLDEQHNLLQLESDPNLAPAAWRTQQALPSFQYLGLTGSLRQGLNAKLPRRIASTPWRPLLGALQLALLYWLLRSLKKRKGVVLLLCLLVIIS